MHKILHFSTSAHLSAASQKITVPSDNSTDKLHGRSLCEVTETSDKVMLAVSWSGEFCCAKLLIATSVVLPWRTSSQVILTTMTQAFVCHPPDFVFELSDFLLETLDDQARINFLVHHHLQAHTVA